eukprot:1573078-Rhodomonas_salina.1
MSQSLTTESKEAVARRSGLFGRKSCSGSSCPPTPHAVVRQTHAQPHRARLLRHRHAETLRARADAETACVCVRCVSSERAAWC